MAGHQIGIALLVWLPGDGGLSLGLLWHPSLIIKCRAKWHIQLQDGYSATLCIKGYKHQGLTNLPKGRLWVATVPIISVVTVVVVLSVLHMLALTAMPILAPDMDCVVRVGFRHIQPVARTSTRAGRQRQRKQGVWVWAGEMGLGKQAG